MTKYDFAMLEIFDSAVPIKEQGEVKMMSSVQAVAKAQLVKALSGDAMAQRDYLKRADILGQQRQQKQQEERAFWQDYIDNFDNLCRSYNDKGQELPQDLIYPFFRDGTVKAFVRNDPAMIPQRSAPVSTASSCVIIIPCALNIALVFGQARGSTRTFRLVKSLMSRYSISAYRCITAEVKRSKKTRLKKR